MSFTNANQSVVRKIGAYLSLVAAGEPYRLLFPLGAMIGLYGVLMWSFYVWNLSPIYPGPLHARLMIEGFLTAFVIGFLGTALPRLLEVPRLHFGETLGFAATLLGITWLHGNGRTFWGDQLFFATIAALVCLLGTRAFFFRKDNPPPGFVLVLLGLGCALFGSMVQVVMSISPMAFPEWMIRLSRLLLYQGYPLFPIMGIGAFLLPRFFGLPNRQDFPESLAFTPEWLKGAAFALFCALLVMAGFIFEAMDQPGWGYGLRALGVLIYLGREVPIYKAGWAGGSLASGLRIALVSIPLAYALMAIWPEHSFSFLHVLLIGGFSLITLIVASRVIWGHSGQNAKFRASLWSVRVLVALVSLAMLTRVSADWMPERRLSHYAYAAVTWAAAMMIWVVFIVPGVSRKDEE